MELRACHHAFLARDLDDPSGNALEFKAFRRPDEIFAR